MAPWVEMLWGGTEWGGVVLELFLGSFGSKVLADCLQNMAQEFSINAALSFQVSAQFVVLRKPESLKAAALGEALSVGSRNFLVQRRSRPRTWTYDPRPCPQPAHRGPQDGLLPQAQAALPELPGAQRPAPLPGRSPGPAAELQLGLEQVGEAAMGGVGPPGPGLASAASQISASEGHRFRAMEEERMPSYRDCVPAVLVSAEAAWIPGASRPAEPVT